RSQQFRQGQFRRRRMAPVRLMCRVCDALTVRSRLYSTNPRSSAWCECSARVALLSATLFAGTIGFALADMSTEQQAQLPQVRSENLRYAQYWGPYERGFFVGPRRGSRFDQDTGPPPDERLAKATKQKVIEQLRTATPPPPPTGPLLLVVSIKKQTI